MQPDDFYIVIEPISELEARDVVDFKRSKSVAKLSGKQYEELVRKNQSRCCCWRLTWKKLKMGKAIVAACEKEKAKKKASKHGVSQSKTKQSKFRLPLLISGRPIGRGVSLKPKALPRAAGSREDLGKAGSLATGAQHRPAISRETLPKCQKLIDLIPPDVDVFGLDMEQLYLNTPETDESDCDSVSYFGSDDSY